MTDEIAKTLRPGDVVVIKSGESIDQKAIPEQNRYHFHGNTFHSAVSPTTSRHIEVAYTPTRLVETVRKSEEAIIENSEKLISGPIVAVLNPVFDIPANNTAVEIKMNTAPVVSENREEGVEKNNQSKAPVPQLVTPQKILLDREPT